MRCGWYFLDLGLHPTAALMPHLIRRGSTSLRRLLRKDDLYRELYLKRSFVSNFFTGSSYMNMVLPSVCSIRINLMTYRKSCLVPVLQHDSKIPLGGKRKGYKLRKRFPGRFGCFSWVGVPEGSHRHQNPVAGLGRAACVIKCCRLVNNPDAPSGYRKSRGHKELLHLVCKESLELWGWSGLSTS